MYSPDRYGYGFFASVLGATVNEVLESRMVLTYPLRMVPKERPSRSSWVNSSPGSRCLRFQYRNLMELSLMNLLLSCSEPEKNLYLRASFSTFHFSSISSGEAIRSKIFALSRE